MNARYVLPIVVALASLLVSLGCADSPSSGLPGTPPGAGPGAAQTDPGTQPGPDAGSPTQPGQPGTGDPVPVDPNAPEPGDPTEPQPIPAVDHNQEVEAFASELSAELTRLDGLAADAFMEQFAPPSELQLSGISYDPMSSTYMSDIAEQLKLNEAEKAAIAEQGFAVSGRLRYESYGAAYVDVYRRHLPVVLTADSVLHALHKSFDNILKIVETTVLRPLMLELLADAHGALSAPAGDDADLAGAAADVDVILSVARSLLAGEPVPAADAASQEEVDRLLALAAEEKMVQTTIFGRSRKVDFSQLKPRGHYTESEELKTYFRAMMWLGRVDLRPVDQVQDHMDQGLVFLRRQMLGAVLLTTLLEESGVMEDWAKADELLTKMIGRRDSLGPPGLRAFMDELELSDLEAVAAADPDALYAGLLAGGYGAQRIRSHWIETNPYATEPAPLPVSFLLMGQRFTVDSHVFSNVVYDSVIVDGQKIPRVLPMPLDVAFALGNDAATPLLREELERFPYQESLALMRWYMDGYDEGFWAESLYNTWLSALRALNPSLQDPGALPETLRTEAWQRKLLHTQLQSWAELRHDTLLYAKQSYTGGIACAYPAGYVEPYPELYGRIGAFAQSFSATLRGLGKDRLKYMADKLDRTAEIMGSLEVMAKKELDGEPFDEAEEEMMRTLIDFDPGCGDPIVFGWYGELYAGEGVKDRDVIIADVHTNPNTGPLPGPNVLHVGTGDVYMMVLSIDTCDGPMAFAGPVQSYHEVDIKEIRRLTDEEWKETHDAGEGAAVPAFEAPLWPTPPLTGEFQRPFMPLPE